MSTATLLEIEKKHREQMRCLAQILDGHFNREIPEGGDPKTGFVLLVFPVNGELGRMNYISNVTNRKDMTAAMLEFIAKWEGQAEAEAKERARIVEYFKRGEPMKRSK